MKAVFQVYWQSMAKMLIAPLLQMSYMNIFVYLYPFPELFFTIRGLKRERVRFGTFLYFCGSVSLNEKIIPQSPCENCTAC